MEHATVKDVHPIIAQLPAEAAGLTVTGRMKENVLVSACVPNAHVGAMLALGWRTTPNTPYYPKGTQRMSKGLG